MTANASLRAPLQARTFSGLCKDGTKSIYAQIRQETYGEDIGQTGWTTKSEYRRFLRFLNLTADCNVLEIASGPGGPALFTVQETGCSLTGIDSDMEGVKNAVCLAAEHGLGRKMSFLLCDVTTALPFAEARFDAVICNDSIHHLPAPRIAVLKESFRVLKKGGRLLYTDAMVLTGAVSNEEMAICTYAGFFQCMPQGGNESLLTATGFDKIKTEDTTAHLAEVSLRWYKARRKRKAELLDHEAFSTYGTVQAFLGATHVLAEEKRLSRFVYTALKPY